MCYIDRVQVKVKFQFTYLEFISGLRAPFLQVGWNRQFLMMLEFGFVYDSSIVVPFLNTPIWPYTLDYKIPYACAGSDQLCPTRVYPGIWELPLNQFVAGVSNHCKLRNFKKLLIKL